MPWLLGFCFLGKVLFVQVVVFTSCMLVVLSYLIFSSTLDKTCAFCNCGGERQMFQGKLCRCTPSPGFNPFKKAASRQHQSYEERFDLELKDLDAEEMQEEIQPIVHRRGPGRPPGRGRRKGIVVIGLPVRNSNQMLTADKCTFGTIKEKEVDEVFEPDGHTWAHHCCAAWSEGVCQTDSYDLVNVDKAVFKAMTEVIERFPNTINSKHIL